MLANASALLPQTLTVCWREQQQISSGWLSLIRKKNKKKEWNSIKGNLYCNVFQRPLKKISSKRQQQTANLISFSLTGLLQGCLSSLLSRFAPQTRSSPLSHSHFTLSPRPSLFPNPSFSHSDTLFSTFTVTSWVAIGSQTRTKGTGAVTRDESPLFMQPNCTQQTGDPLSVVTQALLHKAFKPPAAILEQN